MFSRNGLHTVVAAGRSKTISEAFFWVMLNIDDRLIKETLPVIKPNGLAVLMVISIHLNKESGTCFPSHKRLMDMTGLGSESVYNALKALKKEGLLISSQSIDSKHKTFSRRTFQINTDYIGIFVSAKNAPALEIEPLTDLPYTAEPDAVEPDAVEPDAANQETYLLNEYQQLNELEHLNNLEQLKRCAASTFKIEIFEPSTVEVFQTNQPDQPLNENPKKAKNFNGGGAAKNSAKPIIQIHPENEPHFAYFSNPDKAKAAWMDWIEYKYTQHREKYKDAKTELSKLRQLFKQFNGDSAKLEEAVSYSIGNLYKGIFAPKIEKQDGKFQHYDKAQQQHIKLARFVADIHSGSAFADAGKVEYITGDK